jgi:hypothetical protein
VAVLRSDPGSRPRHRPGKIFRFVRRAGRHLRYLSRSDTEEADDVGASVVDVLKRTLVHGFRTFCSEATSTASGAD